MNLFVASLGQASSKEGRDAILIVDMDISRLMVYVQKAEEEKLKDREEYKNKRSKILMSLTNRKVSQVEHNLRNKRGMQHHMLVHLLPGTEFSLVAIIRSTSRILSPEVVWHKEVVEFLHVVDLVQPIG